MVALRDAMSSLLEEGFVHHRSLGGLGALGLSVDLRETPDGFELSASVPGVDPDAVTITVLGDTIRISGERRDDPVQAGADSRWLIRERHFGAFDRTIRLPAQVDAEGTEARFQDGVLKVVMPKAENTRAVTIPVRAGTT
jgi:HSP20 family protein